MKTPWWLKRRVPKSESLGGCIRLPTGEHQGLVLKAFPESDETEMFGLWYSPRSINPTPAVISSWWKFQIIGWRGTEGTERCLDLMTSGLYRWHLILLWVHLGIQALELNVFKVASMNTPSPGLGSPLTLNNDLFSPYMYTCTYTYIFLSFTTNLEF